ncbi:hypothetical protein [Cupriavidus necator]|uniref:hypothetical protein n=1 Tax=Cupriavidus necator TaxID=106590 RepID=UPI00059EDE78|nr:hypothetical protein [Cupriavidus necator]
MSLQTPPSSFAPTWALHCTRFRGQTPPRACLYLLADLRRGVALSAMLAEQPLGRALASWLEAAAIGRVAPQAMQSTDLPSEQDRQALYAWIAAHDVVLEPQNPWGRSWKPVDQLLHSAWESLGLAPGAFGEVPTWAGAQQRLDLWFREHCQHVSGT